MKPEAQQTPWLQQKLEAIWYKKESSLLFYLLLPLSALFCFLSRIRRNKTENQQEPLPIPIVVVGNISVGGTGKTPLVIKLTELLKDNGYNPAIITRGYKGVSSIWPLHVKPTTETRLSGDEAKLMAIRTNVPVIAGANRVEDIQYVLDNTDCNIIISDDGLQHYRMKRDIEIVVIDAQRRFGNGHCLPAGPLRERSNRLDECDFLISNGTNKQPAFRVGPVITESTMQVSGTELINISNHEKRSLSSFQKIQMVTGIGNPQRFINTLETAGLSISKALLFPDHHHFVAEDFNLSSDTPIVMTEKDAVKCTELGLQNCWYLPVNAKLEQAFETNFLNKVAESFDQIFHPNT